MFNRVTVPLAILNLFGVFASIASLQSESPLKAWLVLATAIVLVISGGLYAWERIVPLWRQRLFNAAKELGIREIQPRGLGGQRHIRTMISTAKGPLMMMAVSSRALIFNHKTSIVVALVNEAKLRVLIATPDSQFVRDIERVESPTRAGQITDEIISVEKFLAEYLADAEKQSQGAVGTVMPGHYSTDLRCSLILRGNEWGWLTLNLPPRRAIETCSFELEPVSDGLLAVSKLHFERAWELAKADGRVKIISSASAA